MSDSLQGLQKCCRDIFSWRTGRGSRHGKCREVSGENLLFLFPQETKLESGQNFFTTNSTPFLTRCIAAANALFLHFPNMPCTQTCLQTWHQARFLLHFSVGKGVVPWYGPSDTVGSTPQEEPCDTTCLWGWYKARFFGLIFGHSWGIGEGPGWHLVTLASA